ncbi:hypothetical protein QBC47DRAFT_384909 [Echria macrotheca]|uniref:Uncharacterized protein n=1 Tax=Echria macrotheca TaxID=438768 RepID=A0AAJ0BB40_9PEZI|nr:hypothetical protein QBC47DRAFT_384909 [Echria macrotheca]
MFEVPDAKRVRRQDLYDSASERDDSSPDDDVPEEEDDGQIRAELNARLASLLSLDLQSGGDITRQDDEKTLVDQRQQSPEDDEAEFEFRLFSTSGPSQKVVLAAEGEGKHDGPAFSSRPLSFYVRGELSAEEKAAFQFAAMTGDEVLAQSKTRAWGLELPWRVTRIVVSQPSGKPGATAECSSSISRGRKRPGKKGRIKLRIKDKARKEALAAAEKQKMTKEEHLREKKKRLNREKKLKRRQKEKEKKMAVKGGEGEAASAASGAESDSK